MVCGGVLLTGATGFVGMQVLARYLQRTGMHVYALVRASSEREAQERLQGTLRLLFGAHHPYRERVTAVVGDITLPHLGISRPEQLAERIDEIVHGAASVSFGLDLESARAINLEGTRAMLQLAQLSHRHGGLRRFAYISTAYVGGDRAGSFGESDLDVGQRFRNAYEQSKFEAERLVGQHRGELPITVLRPSIVVGERTTGWTTSFNVLYWPLRAYAQGAYTLLPARRGCPVDVVSVDYVADAILHLAHAREAEGAVFHLTAGPAASRVGEIVELASAFFDRPPPRLLDPWVYRRAVHPLLVRMSGDERTRRTLKRSEVLFPYFSSEVTFDNRRARVLLGPAGISPTPLPRYFNRLVEFALAAEWGRRQLPHPRTLWGAGAARFARPGAWGMLEPLAQPSHSRRGAMPGREAIPHRDATSRRGTAPRPEVALTR